MKSYNLKSADIAKQWWIVDAKDMVLGRLAASLSTILRGKHKSHYTPYLDCGDPVVVINARHVRLTGAKLANKTYYRHTGYPGGIKETTAGKILEGPFPERALRLAVRRMIPSGPLGRSQLKQLKIFSGETHDHEAQNPTVLDLASRNRKNSTLN